MLIIPAVLEKNSSSFFVQIKRLTSYFRYFQIDIADGKYVPNRTLQIEDLENHLPHFHFNNLTQSLIFDFHLMVKDYHHEVEKLIRLQHLMKIRHVFIHASLAPPLPSLILNFRSVTLGLVLNPEDKVADLKKKYKFERIPVIQIMTIHPAFQGTPFLSETLHKIEELRTSGYTNKIFLDGGIDNQILTHIASQRYLPDAVVIGSFLTKSKDLKKSVDQIKTP